MLFFCFVLFLTIFFKIIVKIENARLKLALANTTSAPITIANGVTEMLPLTAMLLQIKQLTTYQKSQKKQYIY